MHLTYIFKTIFFQGSLNNVLRKFVNETHNLINLIKFQLMVFVGSKQDLKRGQYIMKNDIYKIIF